MHACPKVKRKRKYFNSPDLAIPKMLPERDQGYLNDLKTEPCCMCYPVGHKERPVVPRLPAGGDAHHAGRRGKGTSEKCSDYQAVPACRRHHNLCNAPKGGNKVVQRRFGVNFEEVWTAYMAKYGKEFNNGT